MCRLSNKPCATSLITKAEKYRPSTPPSTKEEQPPVPPSQTTFEVKSHSGKSGIPTSINSRRRAKMMKKQPTRKSKNILLVIQEDTLNPSKDV
jgi:hypothetical protein